MKRGVQNSISTRDGELAQIEIDDLQEDMEVDTRNNNDDIDESVREAFENYLRELSYSIDRGTIKSQLNELIVKYNINLGEPMPFCESVLIYWALENSCSLLFVDVVLELYTELGFELNEFKYEDDISLVQDSMSKNLKLQAQLLASHGLDPNYIDENGKTELVASRTLEEISSFTDKLSNAIHPGNVKEVIDEFLKDNLADTPLDNVNSSLLHKAIEFRVIKPDLEYLVRLYLQKGYGIELTDLYGATPLIRAILNNDLSAVNLLLKNNANVAHKDNFSKSVLEYAMECKRDDVFKLIYDKAPESERNPEMQLRYKKIEEEAETSRFLLFNEQFKRKSIRHTPEEISQFVTLNSSFQIKSNPSSPRLPNKMSAEHAKRWVESHPQDLQSLAQKLIDNIKHVDFATFKSQLATCAQSLKLPPKYILVMPEETDKSNAWVFSHALPYLSHLPFKVLKPSEIADFIQERDDKRYDLLFVDDAAFSGTQTKELLVDQAFMSFNNDQEVNIHYLIPFMTKRARELLMRHNEAMFGSYKVIEGISSVFTNEEKEILQHYNVNSTDKDVKHHLNWPELTLTYFEHKIADWKSAFPGIMREGRTINDINARLPFIPITIEPYKSNVSLPSHVLQGLLDGQYSMGLPKLSNVSTESEPTKYKKIQM